MQYTVNIACTVQRTFTSIRRLTKLVQVFPFSWLVQFAVQRNKKFQYSVKLKDYNWYNQGTYDCIQEVTNFQNTKLHNFRNLSLLLFILEIFLKFRTFQPRFSYKTYSLKK